MLQGQEENSSVFYTCLCALHYYLHLGHRRAHVMHSRVTSAVLGVTCHTEQGTFTSACEKQVPRNGAEETSSVDLCWLKSTINTLYLFILAFSDTAVSDFCPKSVQTACRGRKHGL